MATKKTTKKTAPKKTTTSTKNTGIALALTSAAVAAAGTYFLAGSKNAAKNRKAVKSWMLKAKAEALEALEDAKKMTAEEYEVMIDNLAASYGALTKVTKKDIAEFQEEMKGHWKKIERSQKKK